MQKIMIMFCFFLVIYPCIAHGQGDKKLINPELQTIYLGETSVLRTSEKVIRVMVGDGRIAVARAISPTEILLKGSNPGWTNLVLWFTGKTPAKVYRLKVEISPVIIKNVENLVKTFVPDSSVRLIQANEELLVDGSVTSQEDMHRVLQIISAYFRKHNKTKSNKADEGKSSTTINISTGKGSSDAGLGNNGKLLQENFNLDIAIRNNLMVLKGYQQVQLEVKIAEVSRSALKSMGLGFLNNQGWSIGIFPSGSGSVKGSMADSKTIPSDDSGHSASRTLDSVAELGSPFGSAFQVLLHSAHGDALSIISLLKGQGAARFLATPTLVTMNGQEANFTVGGEFPIPVTDQSGNTNVEYKNYGVILRFTPFIIRKETITLKISPEVSEPDWSLGTASGGVSVPGLKTRKGSTTLQLKDGQTFVMAGLLKETSSTVTSKIPFLGDIPVLGTLFTKKEFQNNESELVIIVTPRLVRPLDSRELPDLPGENINDNQRDINFYLLNITEGQKIKTKSMKKTPLPGYTGKLGFSR